MIRLRLAALAAVPAIFAPSAAGGAGTPLPAPVLTVKGHLEALTAAGRYAAIASAALGARCTIAIVDPTRGSSVRLVDGPTPCLGQHVGPAVVSSLWLGNHAIMAEAIASPSPHGDSYSLWTAPLGGSSVTQYGDAWGWNDSAGDTPSGQGSIGCAYSVAAGGGAIVAVTVPNLLGSLEVGGTDVDTCLPTANPSTHIAFRDGPVAGFDISGAWKPLATDGKRVLLEALGPDGNPTGQLSFAALDGSTSAAPPVPAGFLGKASAGWVVPEGVVLQNLNRIAAWPAHGRTWSVSSVDDAAVGEGRVAYVKGRVVHIRRIADGADRVLAVLPAGGSVMVGAGSFGIAVASDQSGKTALYRIPWKTVDRVLRAS